MKYSVQLIVIAAAAAALIAASAKKCQLPIPANDFKMQTLNGTWYSTFNGGDPIMADDIGCATFHDFMVTDDGYTYKITHYIEGSPVERFHAHALQQEGDIYNADEILEAHKFGKYHKLNVNAMNEDQSTILRLEYIVISDFYNYHIKVWCSDEGDWIIWAYAPTPKPSNEQLMMAVNALQNRGISAHYVMSQCSSVDFDK